MAGIAHAPHVWRELRLFNTVFFQAIPIFFIWSWSNLPRLGSMKNLHQTLVLDWSLEWYGFWENRYLHRKNKPCAKKIENKKKWYQYLRLCYTASQIYKSKKNSLCKKIAKMYQTMLFCIIMIKGLPRMHCIDEMTSNNHQHVHLTYFSVLKTLCRNSPLRFRKCFFSYDLFHYNFWRIFHFECFFQKSYKLSDRFFKKLPIVCLTIMPKIKL